MDELQSPKRHLGKSAREKEQELLSREFIKDVDKKMPEVRTEARRYAFPVVIMITGLIFLTWSILKMPLHGYIYQLDLIGPTLFFLGYGWGHISKTRLKKELDNFSHEESKIVYGK